MKKIFLILAFFLPTLYFAQPSNDNCGTPISLGTLAAPGACGTGVRTGATTTINTTNVAATPENPYLTLGGCGMASPANSVWYTFVAPTNGYGVTISVSNGGAALANPNIALWGGNCSGLTGQGCVVGAGGTATLTVAAGIVAGQTYYIQISGNTGQSGPFKLSVNAFQDCNDCLNASSMTVNPLPVNGSYLPGQSVTFCYHIDQWTNANTNWLHGVQLTFGNGWDYPATFVPNPPNDACGAAGATWNWYPSGITGFAQAGFYFDGNCALGPGSSDGNPANNFGDLPSGTGAAGTVINVAANDWKFCWTIKVKTGCNPGQSLAVTVNTSGDGESGSWTDNGCTSDPPTNFNAIAACCPPTMASTSVTCFGLANGSATATPVGSAGPYTYNWTGPAGYSNTQTGVAGNGIVTGLAAGVYTLLTTDVNLCGKTTTVQVTQPTSVTATPTVTNATCVALGSANATASGGTPGYTYSWTPSGGTGATASGLNAGTYTVTIRDANLCVLTKTVTITSTGTVTSTFTGAGTQCFTGNSFTFVNTGTTGAGITHAYTFSPSAGAPANSPTTTVANYGPVSFTLPGTYTVSQTVTNGVCVNTTTALVTVNPNPLATLTATNPTCGLSNGIVFINNTSCCAQTISGFASSLGSVSGQTVTGLGAGTPVITLTNSFGCTYTVSTTLTMTPFPTSISTTTASTTCGNANGSLSFTASPGTAPYTYSVNGMAATSPTTGLTAGSYVVKVRDTNGCTFSVTATISNIPGPTAMTIVTSPASCAGATGSATVTGVTGGTPTYSYSINGGAFGTSTTFGSLANGTYTIVVKDANACTYSTTATVALLAGITSANVNSTAASCGTANGSATVTSVTGGMPTYSYSFNGGAFSTTNSIGSLTAGSHTVIVRDVNTCTLSVPFTVLSIGSPSTSITSFSNVTCFGGSNGSFTVATPSGGGGAPYTYTLTSPFQVVGPTAGTGQFGSLLAGTYNIQVRDAAGCIATTTVVINQPAALTLSPSSIPAKCFGASTGTVSVVGSGGTPGYSYNFNGNPYQSSSTFTTMGAGVYNMGIRDNNGCTATQTVEVTQPTALAISLSTQNANCTAANGIASATVTGGTPAYIYSWTGGGGAGATTNSLVSGSYSVTVTDGNGCVITGAATIGNTPGGTASITGSTNITCNGANDGSMTAGMTGGASPFTYAWSPGGQTNSTASSLAPGTYTCIITDFYGCKASASGTIIQPSPLTSIMNSNNVKCFGTATGTVSAAGVGGTAPYTYLWTTLASTLSTVPNVAVGNYPCNITDANGCTITSSIAVTQPSSITLTSTVTAANCNQANGSATVTASGGTPAYSYTWSTGTTGAVLSSVAAGTYTIDVKDGNNCIQTLAATIPNLSGPSISISSQTNVSCFGGNNGVAATTVTGGTSPYIYSWSNGQVTGTGTNLSANVYTVSVTDQAGCVASTSVSISQPPVLTVNLTPTDPKCFGATNGSGIAAALGGTPGYSYAWTTTGGTSASSNPYGAGQHGVTVTDANGCTTTATMTLVNPDAMTASITYTNVTCFNACNGLAVGSSMNGIGAVNYFWVGGASPISAQTASGLCPGTYTMTATDQNSCTATSQVTINQPTQVTANIASSGSVTCNGGSNGFASVNAGGGTPGYTYVWTGAASAAGNSASTGNILPAGTYSVTISDANNCTATTDVTILEPAPLATTLTVTNPKCNGSLDGTGNVAYTGGSGLPTFLWQPALQGGNSVNSLGAGNQSVTITYNGSCQTTLTFTLTDPPALTTAVTATNSNCGQNNGRTFATVGGGTAPLSYLWSNGIANLNNPNVTAGPYTFTVTDANNCTAVASALVNDIAGPSVVVTSTLGVKCFGGNDGAATTNISGGVTPYTISWTGNPSTSQNVTDFNAGIHNITVTDAANCIGTASVNITQPAALTSAIGSFTNVSCNAGTNGGATMLVNGGTVNYNYSWTPSGQTSSVLTGVGADTYTCMVTDANNCGTSQVVTISQPLPLVMTNSVVTNITCNGLNNGQISVTLQGGTPGYSYTWTPSQPGNPLITSLPPGGYNLSAADQNGCPINANFTVTEPSAITSNFTSLPAKCGIANGSATVSVNGGTQLAPPTLYNISWNTPTPQSGTVATNMGPGTNWQAVITDANGCTHTQTVTVPNAPSPIITGFTTNQPLCFGQPNGTITVNFTSGTPNYTITWSAPISQTQTTTGFSQTVTGVTSGAYTATVTDTYGCSSTQPVTVSQPPFLALNVSPNVTICYGQSTQVYASAGGGTGPYTYTWTPNIGSTGGPITVNPTTSTQYNVAMSDANGCSPTPKVITVNVRAPLTASGYAVTKCDGQTAMLTPNLTSVGNGGPYDFIWSSGTTHTSVATSSVNVTANYATNPNTYTVTIDDHCTMPSATAVFTVNVNPLPIGDFTATPLQGCAPLTVTLTGTSNGANDIFYWTDNRNHLANPGNPMVTTLEDSGKYTISVHIENPNTGCYLDVVKTDYITVYPQPIAAFIADPPTASILEPSIHFINQSQGATNYFWDFGDPAAVSGNNTSVLVNPTHAYNTSGIFMVHLVAISDKGCRDTTALPVEITPDFALYIPNTFTPDDNGVNDIFQPLGVGINEDNYRMDVFDRWGELIFTSNNFRKGWDGSVKGNSKMAPQGVYVYKITVYDLQGNKHPFVGHVTVLRAN